MADKKMVVDHPKLYMVVGGKMQHVKPGTEVTVSEEQAKKLGEKLKVAEGKKSVTADKPKQK